MAGLALSLFGAALVAVANFDVWVDGNVIVPYSFGIGITWRCSGYCYAPPLNLAVESQFGKTENFPPTAGLVELKTFVPRRDCNSRHIP